MPSNLHTPFSVGFAARDDLQELGRVLRAGLAFYAEGSGRMPPPVYFDFRERIEQSLVLKLSEDRLGVGYATLKNAPPALYIDAIAIRPSRQRKGGGRLLIAAAERLASELCLPIVALHTPADKGPLAFYRALGFIETERERTAGGASVRFEKRVESALSKLLRS